jgi:phosphoribosylformylglycinamidine (FGAM) synthase-like amidotransferase family enzyme
MAAVRVLILRAPGANCDGETQYAFELAGAVAEHFPSCASGAVTSVEPEK